MQQTELYTEKLCPKCEVIRTRHVILWNPEKLSSREGKGRAGVIMIYRNKVLLVQCYGKHWGFPKGGVEDDETLIECALRELKEETTIELTANDLKDCKRIQIDSVTYFLVQSEKMYPINLTAFPDNDVTGVGWVHIRCIPRLNGNITTHIKRWLRLT